MEDITPTGKHLLIEELAQTETPSGIKLPDNPQGLTRGLVLAISPLISSPLHDQGVHLGTEVFWEKTDTSHKVPLRDAHWFVPADQLMATLPDTSKEPAPPGFFEPKGWPAFRKINSNDDSYNKVWSQWENLKKFTFTIGFLEPFRSLAPFKRLLYESVLRNVGPRLDNTIDTFALESTETDSDQARRYAMSIKDDFWHGIIRLHEDEKAIEFSKQNVNLECLLETTPAWMAAFHEILSSSLFQTIAGTDFQRLTFATMSFEQIIRLEGDGNYDERVRNSVSMGHFVRFGIGETAGELSPTLAQLGISTPIEEAVGRVDLKFSFERVIAERSYTVWLDIKAPLNENASQLHIHWRIHEDNPGDIRERQYAPLLEHFFRDVVLKGFYKEWFKGIRCSSLA